MGKNSRLPTPPRSSHVFRTSITGPDIELIALSAFFSKDVVIDAISHASSEEVILEVTPSIADFEKIKPAFVSREHLRVSYPRLRKETSSLGLDILGYAVDGGDRVSPRGSLPCMGRESGADDDQTVPGGARGVTVLGFEMLAPSFFSSYTPDHIEACGGWNGYARENNRDNFVLVIYGQGRDEADEIDFSRYFFCSLSGQVTKKFVELEDALDRLEDGSKAVASTSILYEFLTQFSAPFLAAPVADVKQKGSGLENLRAQLGNLMTQEAEEFASDDEDANVIALR
jgi:hypothetical protein